MSETRKLAVLEALVETDYSVELAARRLRVGKSTIYRNLRRWGLAPLTTGAIQKEVTQMSKRKEAPNSYIDNRDSTAGRNNENPGLKELDRKYESDPARKGTNSGKGSFVGTYDKGKRY